MKTAFALSILAVMMVGTARAALAREIDNNNGANNHRLYYARTDVALRQRPLSTMDLTPRKPLLRPYDRVTPAPAEDHLPIAVSYHVSPNGPVGLVGIVDLAGSHALDRSLMSNAVANQPGAPSQTIGAALAYNFR